MSFSRWNLVLSLALVAGASASAKAEDAPPPGAEVQGPKDAPAAESPLDATLRMLDVFGDLRLREEMDPAYVDEGGVEHPFRQRPRLRLRLGVAINPIDELSIVVRLTTGTPDDPRSPHQTLGVANEKFAVSLDRVYLAYHPPWAPGLELALGKIPHPFVASPTYSELWFDGDVQPTGASIAYQSPAIGPVVLFAAVGEYFLLEQGQDPDIHMTTAQLGIDVAPIADLRLRLAAELFEYWDPTAGGSTALLKQNRGNATRDDDGDGEPDSFVSDFHLVHVFGEVRYTGLRRVPLVATGGVLHNFGAARGALATGWFVGLEAGQMKEAYDFRVYAQYQAVPRESVFSPYTQDDFAAGTAFDGVVVGAAFLPLSWLNLHLWALITGPHRADADQGEDWRVRLRLDLNAKF